MEGFQPRHRRLGKLCKVLFLNLQPSSSMGPFGPRQNKITVFDVASWILQIHDDLMEVFTENPKYEALCGILVADLYVPYDKDREIPLRESGRESLSRLGIWGMQRTCHSNVTSEPATAESLHCWRRCGVLVCDFQVSWPAESTISDRWRPAWKLMMLMAWSRWAFFEQSFRQALRPESFEICSAPLTRRVCYRLH